MSKKTVLLLLAPSVLILLGFFVLPLIVVLNNSIMDETGSITFHHYLQYFKDSHYLSITWKSIKISLLATFITLLIGYFIAYFTTRYIKSKKLKRVAYIVIISPLFTSAVVRSFGWMVILGNNGFINNTLLALGIISEPIKLLYTETGIIIGLVYILAPFMILSITTVLENIDSRLEEAASDLGLGPFQTFLKVTLPLTVPGILAGSVMVFSLAISAYVTPAMLSGGKVQLIATVIYEQMMQVFNYQFGSAVAFAVLIFSFLIIGLNHYLLRSDWVEEGRR
ncbi:ABC transporter permease [Cytobacillus purgationiresistens]|uniref:Spermidine/putrescine transport system permease protein n=1 Tax=Cytobacillus purgationiresistens TaxID=863449 RepID=A0ABU0AL11_9BACI|nr:ABC transporter permease [Cytobacillus purgationiresistens]MDQ0271725.1 putative spermidine/putrescine transport system permease protein [Cytobacillus purgationiresistens]